jgi:hypothetical protein
MSTRHIKAVLAATLLGLLVAYAGATSAGPLGGYQEVKDLTVYLGTKSVAELRKHPELLPEGHALPSSDHMHHVLIAIFDRATDERITDAVVDVWVSSPIHGDVKKRLHPEAIAGQVTYCNFFTLLPGGAYVIRVDIDRPENQAVTTVRFRPPSAG